MCRAPIPPTREMVLQVNSVMAAAQLVQRELDSPEDISFDSHNVSMVFRDFPDELSFIKAHGNPEVQQRALRESLELYVANATREFQEFQAYLAEAGQNNGDPVLVVEDPAGEDEVESLPVAMLEAAAAGDIDAVLEWLGPEPVPKKRINAKSSDMMHRTLLHMATFENRLDLMTALLERGAAVDPQTAFGTTPYKQALQYKRLVPAARLLLAWGAENVWRDTKISFCNEHCQQPCEISHGCRQFVALVKTDLGGRRCELCGLNGRPDLNDEVGTVGRYYADRGRYIFTVEGSGEQIRVKPVNLRRSDLTP